jgi:hypothetical protein
LTDTNTASRSATIMSNRTGVGLFLLMTTM